MVVYKQMPCFFNWYNHMLCTIFVTLQVGMFAHSSLLNFWRSKENMNIVVQSGCVQTSAMFFQLLQPYVMHNFCYIASGHVCPFFIDELLEIQGKKNFSEI